MQSYGSGRVVPHATQNHQVYNAVEYPQNQQGTLYMTYAPYLSNPPYLQQEPIGYMTYAPYSPYSQQDIGYTTYSPYPLYSQQEIGDRLLQDPMANDMVLHDQQDQNWLFQNRYRRETMPEYRNGEMVMVRCNQQKWLNGVIQRMSRQGMRIWIIDANILMNVPLVLLPTHVLKMTTYSALEALPEAEPMWTIMDHGGYQKVLVQCVRPGHLSHCQLFHVLDNNVCAICKLRISNIIDMVSPWNCYHQVHNHCLQLQMQQSSNIICPSCNESSPRQPNPSKYSSFVHLSPSNGQQQQFDFQCACGFRSVVIGNMNAAIFCPNCHQPLNVDLMTTNMQSSQTLKSMNINPMMVKIQNRELSINMNLNPRTKRIQSREPPINMNLLRAFSKPHETEIPKSSKSSKIQERERFFSAQDFKFGWPMQSFSSHDRLEAIEEGPEVNTSSLESITIGEGPKVNTSSLESTTIEEGREEPSYFPKYLQALSETFENNNISYQNVVAMRSNDQDVQPPSRFQHSLQDGLSYDPFHSHSTKIQNKQYSKARSSLQDGSLSVPYPTSTTPIQNEQPNSQILLQDGLVDATPFFPTTPIQREQSNSQSSLQNDFNDAPSSAPITFFQNELWKDNAFNTKQLATSLSKHALVPRVKLIEIEEAEQPEMDQMTIATIEGHKLWKKESEPYTTIATIEDQSLGKKVSQKITSIVEIEGPKIWEKASEINTNNETTKDYKLWKKVSEPNTIHLASKDQELRKKVSEIVKNLGTNEGLKLDKKASEPNTTIADIEGQKFLKRVSEPNTTIANIEGQKFLKRVSEPNMTNASLQDQKLKMRVSERITTLVVGEGQKLGKRANEPNSIHSTTQNTKLWKKASKLNMVVATNEGHTLWKQMSAIDCTKKLGEDEESEEREKARSSNDFEASSSSVAPMYINHFDGATEGQKLWRRASAIDWSQKLVSDDEIKESKERGSSIDPSSAPMYVNHFADFVKLAMGASSSTAKDIIASASASTSLSILNSPPPLESITPTRISPPPAFFTRASSLFTEAPVWIIHSKNSNDATSTSPTWITVIKDGVDSRKDDKQWE